MRSDSFQLRRHIGVLVGSACVLLAAAANGQTTLDNPVGEYHEYDLSTGVLGNGTNDFEIVFVDVINVPESAWQRVYFDKVALEGESFVRLTSLLDNEVQELDAATMNMWGNTSAYFNGDTLAIELVAAPQTTNNQVSVDVVAVQFPVPGHDFDCGICFTDTRVPSFMNHHGRLLPSGCSATIYSERSCMVTAGHCMAGNLVMEFNVPESRSNCAIQHPPVADQFPVVDLDGVNGGVGNDWAVGVMGTNNLGETPYERYGLFRPIADSPANNGDTADVWGYGIDNECTRNQIQQHHSGPIDGRTSSYYDYTIHTTFGNSGSGLIKDGEVVGVVTHCRSNCPNVATRIDLPAFVAAREALCPSSCLDIDVINLVGGENCAFRLYRGEDGQRGVIMYSQSAGSWDFEGSGYCVSFDIEIPGGNPTSRIVGQGTFQNGGTLAFSRLIPGGLSGEDFRFQGAMAGTCPDTCMSGVWSGTVQ